MLPPGADYVTALAALKTAWIALRKYDLALSNRHVQTLGPTSLKGIDSRSFGQPSEWNPACLRHGEFALTREYMSDWEAAAWEAAKPLMANAT